MAKWQRPTNHPPPLFTGTPEKDYQKQISDEVVEYIIGQNLLYFPIDMNNTNFHFLYKEAVVKVFLNPIQIYGMIEYTDENTIINKYGIDRRATIKVHFPKRRIVEDKNLYIREGDFIFYNNEFHEIAKLQEPKELYGRIEEKIEIIAICVKARSAPNVSNRG